MRAWSQRPFEVANLINPAFTGILCREFAKFFQKESGEPPDVLLFFVALPLTLHRETRLLLPTTVKTKHHVWLEAHPELRVGFAERCRATAPHVREAISFATGHGWLSVAPPHNLAAEKMALKQGWKELGDNAAHTKAAGFLGRWLAAAGPVPTIYALWGVTL